MSFRRTHNRIYTIQKGLTQALIIPGVLLTENGFWNDAIGDE